MRLNRSGSAAGDALATKAKDQQRDAVENARMMILAVILCLPR
jgi:hypothetical protein